MRLSDGLDLSVRQAQLRRCRCGGKGRSCLRERIVLGRRWPCATPNAKAVELKMLPRLEAFSQVMLLKRSMVL